MIISSVGGTIDFSKMTQNKILFDFKKAVQAVNYFALQSREKGRNKLLIVKLMWAADRYHLRKYGRPVTGDIYFAMKNGPVSSTVLNILDQKKSDKHIAKPENIKYMTSYVSKNSDVISSSAPVDMNEFSETDIEALNFALVHFKNKRSLIDYIHKYPEWKKHESVLNTKKRVDMDYLDFFLDPSSQDISDDPFKIEDHLKECAKDEFQEYLAISKALYS